MPDYLKHWQVGYFAQGCRNNIILRLKARDVICITHVMVELDGNRFFAVFFTIQFGPQQDLQESAKHTGLYVARPSA